MTARHLSSLALSLRGEKRMYDRTLALKETGRARWGTLIIALIFAFLYILSNDVQTLMGLLMTLTFVFMMFLIHRLVLNKFHLDRAVTVMVICNIIISTLTLIILFVNSGVFGAYVIIIISMFNFIIIFTMIVMPFKLPKKVSETSLAQAPPPRTN